MLLVRSFEGPTPTPRALRCAPAATPRFKPLEVASCAAAETQDLEPPSPGSTEAPEDGASSGSEGRSGSELEASEEPPRKRLRREASDSCQGGEGPGLEAAAAAAARLFDEVAEGYLRSYRSRGDEAARALAEELAKARYSELAAAITALLPLVGGEERCCEVPQRQQEALGREYRAVEFSGSPLSAAQARRCERLWQRLACAREASPRGLARDALAAALAAVSARGAQVWLEALDLEAGWRAREAAAPRGRRRGAFEAFLRETLAQGARGYFSKALLDPASTLRVALAQPRGCGGAPVPASLLVTYALPLRRALEKMDGGGPLRGAPADWRRWRHFALQDLLPDAPAKEGVRYERVPAKSLEPEPAIRELLRGGSPVVLLDAFAALAPREEARSLGLSAVVQCELDALLREAKAQGRAVVFMLGGNEPETLARKVYLRPPFTNYGLRIGHLRWRETARGPWAREKEEEARVLIGLQLP